jgi:hypothetical protein
VRWRTDGLARGGHHGGMNARQPGRSPASKLKTAAINSIALLREGELGEPLAYGVWFVEVTSRSD